MNLAFVIAIFASNAGNFNPVIWMWEFRPIEKEKQARDREERSSQQFHINNIGRHHTIQAENKDVIHTHCS
jgi:hypothetical protein